MTENELDSIDFIFTGLTPVFDHPVPVLCVGPSVGAG